LLLIVAANAGAQEHESGDLVELHHTDFHPGTLPNTIFVSVDYSNVTSFLGQGFANGGAALQGANTITRLVADDLTPNGVGAGTDVTQIKFSVANFNAVPVTARARIRFWLDNGSGAPGAYYSVPAAVGFSFNPFAFGPGVTILTGTIAPGQFTMPGVLFWAGITFDDNNGTTGATLTQMNNLGQGLFDPPTVGTSADMAFQTTAAGSFFTTANPPGTVFNLGGNPITNFGWEFTTVGPVVPTNKSTWGRIKNLYR